MAETTEEGIPRENSSVVFQRQGALKSALDGIKEINPPVTVIAQMTH